MAMTATGFGLVCLTVALRARQGMLCPTDRLDMAVAALECTEIDTSMLSAVVLFLRDPLAGPAAGGALHDALIAWAARRSPPVALPEYDWQRRADLQ